MSVVVQCLYRQHLSSAPACQPTPPSYLSFQTWRLCSLTFSLIWSEWVAVARVATHTHPYQSTNTPHLHLHSTTWHIHSFQKLVCTASTPRCHRVKTGRPIMWEHGLNLLAVWQATGTVAYHIRSNLVLTLLSHFFTTTISSVNHFNHTHTILINCLKNTSPACVECCQAPPLLPLGVGFLFMDSTVQKTCDWWQWPAGSCHHQVWGGHQVGRRHLPACGCCWDSPLVVSKIPISDGSHTPPTTPNQTTAQMQVDEDGGFKLPGRRRGRGRLSTGTPVTTDPAPPTSQEAGTPNLTQKPPLFKLPVKQVNPNFVFLWNAGGKRKNKKVPTGATPQKNDLDW